MIARPVVARARSTEPSPTRRGSPDVVEKRRAARAFNDLLLGRRPSADDGRTARRRRRLLEELAAGKARGGKRELTPVDVLSRVQELLELGEPLAQLRETCPARPPVASSPEIVDGLRRIHAAYGFRPEVYAFVGVGPALLREAGLVGARDERARDARGPRKAEEVRPTDRRARSGAA